MTEDEWLHSVVPTPMLEYLHGKVSDRKFRLFACACCRQVWHLLVDERSKEAVELAEMFADDEASHTMRLGARRGAQVARSVVPRDFRQAARAAYEATYGIGWEAAWSASHYTMSYAVGNRDGGDSGHLALLRDIFGNPFRPVTFDPRWRTSDVVALAQAIYDDRAFDRLPVLADALMDAGCDDEQVIGHCRRDGPHVRGCWVVDLVLAKE